MKELDKLMKDGKHDVKLALTSGSDKIYEVTDKSSKNSHEISYTGFPLFWIRGKKNDRWATPDECLAIMSMLSDDDNSDSQEHDSSDNRQNLLSAFSLDV